MKIKFIQKIIDKLRGKKNAPKSSIAEDILKNNTVLISEEQTDHVFLQLSGSNNIIDLRNLKIKGIVEINIFGDNNKITFDEHTSIGEYLKIRIGNTSKNFGKANHTEFTVGKNTTFESVQYITYNCNAKCTIGNDCMFAFGITLFNTDAHPLFDISSGEIINKVKGINIGNHCWIGANTAILKNTELADDTIIGWGSVVSGKNAVCHCAMGGNPAKIIKNNITWKKDGRNGYVQNEY